MDKKFMLHISFEIINELNLEKLRHQAFEVGIELEEMPGTNPRIIIATAQHAKDFYRLGALVLAETIFAQNM